MITKPLSLATLIGAALLVGCGGDGGGSPSPSGSASLTLGVSDAPVDDANKVVIAFEDVVLIPLGDDSDSDDDSDDDNDDDNSSSGSPILLNVSQNGELRQVDLLKYQGTSYDTIISSQTLSPGKYAMCVYVKDGTQLNDDSLSYVEKKDGSLKGLVVPSKGSCFGYKPSTTDQGRLKFSGKGENLEISTGNNRFVLEFDLRKGLADPQGQDYMLMNSNAVTLVNLSESGEIEGDVSVQQYQACESDSLGGPFSHAVYLYPGDIGQSQMGDMGATDPALVEPIAIADVSSSEDDSGDTEYDYEFGFIGPGTYSLGYTCTAYVDKSDSAQTDTDGFEIFAAYGPVVVTAGQSTELDIVPVQ